MTVAACDGNFAGRALQAACDDCTHPLVAHDLAHRCAVCQIAADVQAQVNAILAVFETQADERLTQIYQAIKMLEEVIDHAT